MPSKRENVASAVLALLTTALPSAVVERESDGQDSVPTGGHVVLRDRGSPEPERTIGVVTYWHLHNFDVEVYAAATGVADRFQVLDGMLLAIDAALAADTTIGDVVHACDWVVEQMEDVTDDGADTVRAALIKLTCEYQTATPLG